MIGAQRPFAELFNHLSCSKKAIGNAGEQWLAQSLEKQGLEIATNHKWKRGDLQIFMADGSERFIEVKTARKSTDGRWHFRLYKMDKYGSTDHRRTDFVALLCVMASGDVIPFIVPTSELRHQTNVVIGVNPRTYAGKYAAFRQKSGKLKIN